MWGGDPSIHPSTAVCFHIDGSGAEREALLLGRVRQREEESGCFSKGGTNLGNLLRGIEAAFLAGKRQIPFGFYLEK